MAHTTLYLDEVMGANDADMNKPIPGYRFSNGRSFFGENDVRSPFVYGSTGQTFPAGTMITAKLGIFQGTPWVDGIGVWSDNEVWIDG